MGVPDLPRVPDVVRGPLEYPLADARRADRHCPAGLDLRQVERSHDGVGVRRGHRSTVGSRSRFGPRLRLARPAGAVASS